MDGSRMIHRCGKSVVEGIADYSYHHAFGWLVAIVTQLGT